MVHQEGPKNRDIYEFLEVLQEVPERDRRAAARGRAKFIAEAQSLQAAVSPSSFQRLNHWIATKPIKRILKERSAMKTAIASILLALAILVGGGGITAYAAQDSLPNETLYPIKLFLEDTKYSLTSDPIEQIELLTEFANNRTDEIYALAADEEEVPEEVTTDLQKELQTMLILAAGLDEANTVSVLEQIRLNLRDRDSWESEELGQALTGVPEGIDPAVVLARHVLMNQHRIAEDGMEEPLKFRQAFGYHGGEEDPEVMPEVTPDVTAEVTPEIEPSEDPVEKPGSCTDPDGCKPEETGNPDAGQNGGDQDNGQNDDDNGNNGNNGNNGGNSSSSYYITIGDHLYLFNNGIYTYVGNGQNGGGNGSGNGGGNGGN